jgi:hypothetical protein
MEPASPTATCGHHERHNSQEKRATAASGTPPAEATPFALIGGRGRRGGNRHGGRGDAGIGHGRRRG